MPTSLTSIKIDREQGKKTQRLQVNLSERLTESNNNKKLRSIRARSVEQRCWEATTLQTPDKKGLGRLRDFQTVR